MGLEIVVLRQDPGRNQLLLEDGHEIQQVLRIAVADVVDLVRRHRQPVLTGLAFRRVSHDANHTLDNVVDVGEVAAAVAVVEDTDGLPGAKLVRESEICHVGTARRTVHGEKPQSRRRDVVEFRICMGHQLIALLRGGIEADRIVHLVFRRIWHLRVGAVHR